MSTKTNGAKNEVAPAIPSGWPRLKNHIYGGFVILTITYAFLIAIFDDIIAPFLPAPADEFCAYENGVCSSRADLFSFQIGSGLTIVFCGVVGFLAWHVTRRAHTMVPSTPEGRLFGYLREGEQLAAANFTFQFWDFFISFLIPEQRTAIMLTHHLMAACVSWCSLHNQYLHYYGIFFLGLSEFSSIFLVVVDLFRYFPPAPGTFLDTVSAKICGPLFVLCFVLYRVIMWFPVSYRLWVDVYYVKPWRKDGLAEKLRPGRSYVLYIFLGLNIPLTILQLYFLTIIVEESRKFVDEIATS